MPVLHRVNHHKVDLEEAQRLVGGYVERIRLGREGILLVDEDGLLKGLPVNEEASQVAGYAIVGDALLLTRAGRKGWV